MSPQHSKCVQLTTIVTATPHYSMVRVTIEEAMCYKEYTVYVEPQQKQTLATG